MPRHTPTRAKNTIGTPIPTPIFSSPVRPEEEGLVVGIVPEDEDEVVVMVLEALETTVVDGDCVDVEDDFRTAKAAIGQELDTAAFPASINTATLKLIGVPSALQLSALVWAVLFTSVRLQHAPTSVITLKR